MKDCFDSGLFKKVRVRTNSVYKRHRLLVQQINLFGADYIVKFLLAVNAW